MNSWFIQLETKGANNRISVCDNGLVYGPERNQKLGLLKESAVNEIKSIVNENVYMLKKLGYYINDHRNNLVLRIKDFSRKQRDIKAVGWEQSRKIYYIIIEESNWKKRFSK